MPNYNVEVSADGTQSWYINGKQHREDGPAVICSNGTQFWCINGKIHRDGGPAIFYPYGIEYWYKNDNLHREDGPAVIYSDGEKRWYLNGKQLTEQKFNDRKHSMDVKEITIDGITYIMKRK